MSVRRLLIALSIIVVAAPVASAVAVDIRIEADIVEGTYYWFAGEVRDPDYVVPAGADVTVEVVTRAGFHNLRVKAPVSAKSADVDLPETPTTSFTFSAPASGIAEFVCDYHTTMDGTMTFSATATEVSVSAGQAQATPLPWGLAVAAIALVAASVRRR